jgi:hypothetical protein
MPPWLRDLIITFVVPGGLVIGPALFLARFFRQRRKASNKGVRR